MRRHRGTAGARTEACIREGGRLIVNPAGYALAKRETAGSKAFWAKTWVRQAMAVPAVGMLLAFVGPFGSFHELSFLPRLLYWQAIANLAWWQRRALDRGWQWFEIRARGAELLPWWLRGISVSLVLPLPMIAEARLLRAAMGLPTGISALELYGWIAGTSLMIFALVAGFMRWARAKAAGADGGAAARSSGADANGEDRFLKRLSFARRAALLCIKTEDHYLRVYTEAGEELILLRFGDALTELERADGLRVHRSYWVARRALEASGRQGRKTRLTLVNGLEVPVSDTYLPDLRDAGWVA